MGAEATCRVRLNQQESTGKAHCGDGEIDFRGDFKFRWKWTELSSVESLDGQLVVRRKEDEAIFFLDDAADKWCHSILNPKSRLDKLGLKPGHGYQAWGEFDETFPNELEARAGEPLDAPLDIVFVRVHSVEELKNLLDARAAIKPAGMIWAIWTKGQKEFGENHIREFALQNGLVDVKVAKFSEELSALKLVIPVKDR